MRTAMLLLLMGCSAGKGSDSGEAPLADGFETTLTDSGGCGDVLLWAATAEGDIGLGFTTSGLAAEAHAAGSAQTHTLSLPADGTVSVILGAHVKEGYCVDVPLPEDTITHTYTALSGTATLTLSPTDAPSTSNPADATLVLTDLSLTLDGDPGAQPVTISSFTISATVGMLGG